MELSEKHYLLLAQNGDPDAFGSLIRPYEQKVYLTCLRMMNSNPHDAEDMTQETFIKAWKHIGQFREQSGFGTWLYRIAVNTCLSSHRQSKRAKLVSLTQMAESGIEPQDGNSVEERAVNRQAVLYGLSQISREYRAILVLRDIQGLSYEEISQILNCPIGTVCSRINRAREALSKYLSED